MIARFRNRCVCVEVAYGHKGVGQTSFLVMEEFSVLIVMVIT